ncbi:precorrin-3B synthase [Rhizobium sp. YIM 134829]|uniref:precorrin-3B synthase n=1 Tax=Rhizobium sp. YIM 134829 TaxID=3390453 RepID=UPI00397988E2
MNAKPTITLADAQAAGVPPGTRRGACPSLAAPMATGDGLLVRLRPEGGALSLAALAALGQAADRFGNGRLDVTARGNLQVRGLRPDTVDGFAAALDDAGIAVESGTAIEVPPLAGIDHSERADPRPLAAELKIASRAVSLAPKLTVIVDGGGWLSLSDQSADLRLEAVSAVAWRLALAGTAATAQPIAIVDAAQAVEAVRICFAALASLGPASRGRDLDPAFLQRTVLSECLAQPVPQTAPASAAKGVRMGKPIGRLDIPGCPALGVAPAFGQMRAEALMGLAELAARFGVDAIRPVAGRALLMTGPLLQDADTLARCAAELGFSADAADPVHRIAACTGRAGCASGGLDTQAAARRVLAAAPSLFDGSLDLHLSGCAKGCARPAPAGLVLVATPSGKGLVVGGTASSRPIGYQEEGRLGEAMSTLAGLVEAEKQVGESVAACLKRLEPERIAAVFSRGGPEAGLPRQD